MKLKPKKWSEFQHYKDRLPPWIKLHHDLLRDRDFMCLPLASKAIAPLMWLLASESKNGIFDGSMDELMFRLHISDKEYQQGVKPLIDNGFFTVACGTLAERLQVAIPETETEAERETEKETKKKATGVACPDFVDAQVWTDFLSIRKAKKAPMTETALKGIEREAKKAGWSLEKVISECVTRGWQSFKADWVKEKLSVSEQRQKTMNELTRGMSTPKTPFWAKPDTLEADHVESKRLL